MMIFLFCLLVLTDNTDVHFIKDFQSPAEAGGNDFSDPYSMCFTPQGHLYVLERRPAKIHHWDAEGRYLESFGRKGQGPGEMFFPVKILATENEIWVWEQRQVVSCFDHKGNFVKGFKLPGIRARNFAKISDDQFLISYKKFASPTDLRHIFQLVDSEGVLGEKVKDIKSNYLLAPLKDKTNTTIKAFGPEGDIQTGPDGNLYFGFSQDGVLYRLDPSGTIAGEKKFSLPEEKPTESDRNLVMNMGFSNPRNGDRVTFKDYPGLKIDFTGTKAHYTHFLLKGDKIAFILTPIGSLNGAGNGYHTATYTVNEFETGKQLARGQYQFPEDSTVLFRNGRALAIIAANEGNYQIREIQLAGM